MDEALFRKFKVTAAFIEKDWYRVPTSSQFLEREKEFDFFG